MYDEQDIKPSRSFDDIDREIRGQQRLSALKPPKPQKSFDDIDREVRSQPSPDAVQYPQNPKIGQTIPLRSGITMTYAGDPKDRPAQPPRGSMGWTGEDTDAQGKPTGRGMVYHKPVAAPGEFKSPINMDFRAPTEAQKMADRALQAPSAFQASHPKSTFERIQDQQALEMRQPQTVETDPIRLAQLQRETAEYQARKQRQQAEAATSRNQTLRKIGSALNPAIGLGNALNDAGVPDVNRVLQSGGKSVGSIVRGAAAASTMYPGAEGMYKFITGSSLRDTADRYGRQAEHLTNQASEALLPEQEQDQSFRAKIERGAGSMLPPVGAALATGGGSAMAAGVGALANLGQVASERDQSGVPVSDTRRAMSDTMAVATGMTEALGIGRLLNRVGLKTPLIHRVAQMVEEGGQEYAQDYLNDINAKLVAAYDPQRQINDPLAAKRLESAAIGAILGGAGEVADVGAQRIQQQVQNRAAVRSVANERPNLPTDIRPTTLGPTQIATVPGARPATSAQPTVDTQPHAAQNDFQKHFALRYQNGQFTLDEAIPLEQAPPQNVKALVDVLQGFQTKPDVPPEMAGAARNLLQQVQSRLSQTTPASGVTEPSPAFPRLPEPEGFNARRAKLLGMDVPSEIAINERIAQADKLLGSQNESDQRLGKRILKQSLEEIQKSEGYQGELGQPDDAPKPYTAVRQAIEEKLSKKFSESQNSLAKVSLENEAATPAKSTVPLSKREDARLKAVEFEQQAAQQVAKSLESGRFRDAQDGLRRQKDALAQQRRLIDRSTVEGQTEYRRLGDQIQGVQRQQEAAKAQARQMVRQANAPTTGLAGSQRDKIPNNIVPAENNIVPAENNIVPAENNIVPSETAPLLRPEAIQNPESPARRTATYRVFRGVGGSPNDHGVAGKGEYWSGREHVAKVYAGKTGTVKTGEISLENPLTLNYSQLNDLQTKLYGKSLTGFEPDLSERFDQYLREQGHDGVVLFDPEISTTVPEEVVKLAPRAQPPQQSRASQEYRTLLESPRSPQDVKARKKAITSLMPFNIQGNKSELLAKGLDEFVNAAAKSSKRVIDAFGGAGTYTHYLRSKGLGREGDILNEYDPLRYIAHKQIKENPKAVGEAAQRTVDDLKRLTYTIQEGTPFTEEHANIRRQVTEYFRRRLMGLSAPGQRMTGKIRTGEPVEMQDSPELAGMYTVLQNQAFNFLPVQAEVGKKGFKLPGFAVVGNEAGKVGLFIRGRQQTFNAPSIIADAGKRFQGLDVRRGDGWELIRKDAGEGDFVPVDTSYLNKEGQETTNYSKFTQEDAVPEIYVQKVQENLLPAWDRGAKLLITNNWDDNVASYLTSQGFRVFKDYRQGASRNEQAAGGAAELIAINYDERTGQVFDRGRNAVSSELAGRASQATEQSRGSNADTGRPEELATGTQGQDAPLRGRGNDSRPLAEQQQPSKSFDEIAADVDSETGALQRAIDRSNEREHAMPSEGVGLVSMSPYADMVTRNRDAVDRLYQSGMASQEGKEVFRNLREFAAKNGIEARHLHALADDVRNFELEKARWADRGIDFSTVQSLDEGTARLRDSVLEGAKSLPNVERTALEREVAALDALFDDPNATNLLERAAEGDNNAANGFRKVATEYGIGAETIGDLIEARKPDRSANRAPRQNEARTPQSAGRDTRTTQEREARSATPEEFDLLNRNPATIPTDEFDAHLTAVEKLRNDEIRGIVKLSREDKREMFRQLRNLNEERKFRVQRKELPAKFESRTLPVDKKFVRQSVEKATQPKIAERRSEPMPERYTLRQMADNATAQYREAANRPGVVYLNDWGGAFLNRTLDDVFGVTTTDANFTMGSKDAKDLVNYIRDVQKDTGHDVSRVADELEKAITSAEVKGQDVAFVTRKPSEPLSLTKTKVRHESTHLSQSRLAEDLSTLTGNKWLDTQNNASTIRQELDRRGYPAETHDYEAAAFVASGDYGVFGMDTDQAASFLSDYFNAVVQRHGQRALQKFGAIDPKLQPTLEAARNENPTESQAIRSRTSQEAAGVERASRQGSGDAGNVPSISERRERRDQEKSRIRASFGELESEPQGQVAASGLGGLQNLFNRKPKAQSPAQPVPLPKNFDLANWTQKFYREAMAAGLSKADRAKYDTAKTLKEKNAVLLSAATDPKREQSIFDIIDKADAATGKSDGSALYDALSDATDMMRHRPSERGVERVKKEAGNALNLPRALMASADISAPLRQGAILTLPPSQWGKAAKATVRMFESFSTKQYDRISKEINLHPDAETARDAGLYISTDKSGLVTKKEEDFISNWADKIPLVKHSEQAYKTYLDSLRMDTFARYKKSIDKTKGLSAEQKENAYKAAADWINVATGRGTLGQTFENAMPTLSRFMFAPRYTASRIQVLNPLTYAKNARTVEGRVVLKNQMADMVQYAGVISATLAMAAAYGAQVGLDPDDADFLKIKVGNTRYDTLAGLQQPMRLFYRMGKSLYGRTTGEKTKGNQSTLDIASRFGRSKLAPVPSFFVDYLSGKDFTGQDFKLSKAVADRVTPLMWKDFYDAYQKEGLAGGAKILPGLTGIGVQNYTEKPGTLKPSAFTKAREEMGIKTGELKSKPGEPEAVFNERKTRVEGWMDTYGQKLLDSPRYKAMTDDEQKAAMKLLRARIGRQQNLKQPKSNSFEPNAVLLGVKKSAATKTRRQSKYLYQP